MENIDEEGLYRLMIQVVKTAIVDYKKALNTRRRLWHLPPNSAEISRANGTITEIETFFRGPVFGECFPNLDPEFIIKRIRSYK